MLALSVLGTIVIAACAVVNAATTTMYKYPTTSEANPNYPEGTNEYHCFDASSGVKTYVRGTYGYFGYFEGAVDADNPFMFHVNWWDTYTTDSGTLVPESGSAMLVYDSLFTSMQGPYWSSGTSDMLNSYGAWTAADGSIAADDSTSSGRATILQKCLYPGARKALPRSQVTALVNTSAVSASSEQGQMTFCLMPAGPSVGPWLATYTYIYGDDDGGGTEEGDHGTNPISFWGASGMGMTGLWKASTGSYAGTYGPNIYTIVADNTGTYIVGFYCNVDANNVRTACFTESYTVSGVNNNEGNCPADYRADGSLDALYSYAAVGSALSDSDNSALKAQYKLATGMAILFGLLFFFLALVYGRDLYLRRTNGGGSVPLATREEAHERL